MQGTTRPISRKKSFWLERLPERLSNDAPERERCVSKGAPEHGRLSERAPGRVSEHASEHLPERASQRAPERSPGHVSRMPTPLATQASDELGLKKAPLNRSPIVVTWGWTRL